MPVEVLIQGSLINISPVSYFVDRDFLFVVIDIIDNPPVADPEFRESGQVGAEREEWNNLDVFCQPGEFIGNTEGNSFIEC